MAALLSRKAIFCLFYSLAMTLRQELRLARGIEMLPISAKPSRMTCAPLHLSAMCSAKVSEGRVFQEPSLILIPSSNFSNS